ncbi:MAG: hypothetical protein HWD86_09920 [Kangiellaceae bacterium]|nr:hypothetical protein [Kangiellaceae bacterium]
MSLKKIFAVTTLTLASSAAIAGGVSYDYVQGGYVDYDEADGFNIELSKEFSNNWYGRIDYTDIEGDVDLGLVSFKASGDLMRINVGYKTAISSSTDFVAELGYEDLDGQMLGLANSDSGYNALVGLRGMASNNFELGGYVQYSDVLESTDITVEGRYHFDNNFSVAVEVGHDDESDEHYGVNFRYSF